MFTIRLLSLLSAFFLFSVSLAAQITFTQDDVRFFEKKSSSYQRWLDKTGLGEALYFDRLMLSKENTSLGMLLNIKATDLDTAISLWNRARTDYYSSTGDSLEKKLFMTFVEFMEIPPEQGNIQIYVKDATGEYIKCFYVFVWENEGLIMTKNSIGGCREMIDLNITLNPVRVVRISGKKTTTVPKNLSTDDVFNGIEKFVRERYGVQQCEDRTPVVKVVRTNVSMTVTIENLCKVVLTDEQKSYWCKIMEAMDIVCNDMRRERLIFKFDYLAGSNTLSGYLSGKFGSGVYYPRSESGYYDMEPDFSSYLRTFHSQFQVELKSYLDKL
jgi:hypothetical protein